MLGSNVFGGSSGYANVTNGNISIFCLPNHYIYLSEPVCQKMVDPLSTKKELYQITEPGEQATA